MNCKETLVSCIEQTPNLAYGGERVKSRCTVPLVVLCFGKTGGILDKGYVCLSTYGGESRNRFPYSKPEVTPSSHNELRVVPTPVPQAHYCSLALKSDSPLPPQLPPPQPTPAYPNSFFLYFFLKTLFVSFTWQCTHPKNVSFFKERREKKRSPYDSHSLQRTWSKIQSV